MTRKEFEAYLNDQKISIELQKIIGDYMIR